MLMHLRLCRAAIAAAALLVPAANLARAQSTAAVLFEGSARVVETQWGGLGCPTCPVTDRSASTGGRVTQWRGRLLEPVRGNYMESGELRSEVDFANGTLEMRQAVDNTLSYSGGILINECGASAGGTLWVRGGIGTAFRLTIDVRGSSFAQPGTGIGRGAGYSGNALGYGFGAGGFGASAAGLTQGPTIQHEGCTYSRAGTFGVGASVGAGISCILFCPTVLHDRAFSDFSVSLQITPLEPRLELAPSAIDFGDVPTGNLVQRTLTVRNGGLGDLRGVVRFDGLLFPDDAGGQFFLPQANANGEVGFDLAAGRTQDIIVALRPEAVCHLALPWNQPGEREGTLEVVSNDPSCATVEVPLRGTAIGAYPVNVRYLPDTASNGVVIYRIEFESSTGSIDDVLREWSWQFPAQGLPIPESITGAYELLVLSAGTIGNGSCFDPRNLEVPAPFHFCLPARKRQTSRFVTKLGPNLARMRDQHRLDGPWPSQAAAAQSSGHSYVIDQQWMFDVCEDPDVPLGGPMTIEKGVREVGNTGRFEGFIRVRGNGLDETATIALQ